MAAFLDEHVVRPGDRAVGPEVGEQRETVSLVLRPGAQRELRVDRDADEVHAGILEQRDLVAQRAQLALAGAREGQREEDEHDRLLGAERRESHRAAVLVGEFEVGGEAPDGQRHPCSSLVALMQRTLVGTLSVVTVEWAETLCECH